MGRFWKTSCRAAMGVILLAGMACAQGSLRVTVHPQETIPAGAQWRRAGTETWLNTGYVETGIPAGDYTIQFKDLPGWTTPAEVPVTITDGQTSYSSGRYFLPPGSVRCWGYNQSGESTPPEPNSGFVAISAGSGCSAGLKSDGSIVVWGSSYNGLPNVPSPNADFVSVAAGSTHCLGLKSDGTVVAWGKNYHGERDIPSPNAGFVAIAAGSSHSVGLKADGTIVCWGINEHGELNVPAPNSDFISVAAGCLYSTAIRFGGSVAAWGFNGDGNNNVPSPNDGFLATTLGGCGHNLGLKAGGVIVGWGASNHGQAIVPDPNSGFIGIGAGDMHSLGLRSDGTVVAWGWNDRGQCNVPLPNAGYLAVSGGWEHSMALQKPGSLRVTIYPDEAVTAGAKWRRAGTEPWLNSGDTEYDLVPGNYMTEFLSVPDWVGPVSFEVEVQPEVPTEAVATYTYSPKGALRVTIRPRQVIDEGALWRRVGTETWLDSGTTETGLEPGDYEIEFNNIAYWETPANILVTPEPGVLTDATATYTSYGALTVYIEPWEAADAGAQWRRVGTETWFYSGDIEEGVPAGDGYVVEFSDVPHWVKPENITFTMNRDGYVELTGTYQLAAEGTLCVYIDPQEAADAGAQWRRVGTENWFNSGDAEDYIPEGDWEIEFKDISHWIKPANATYHVDTGGFTEAWESYSFRPEGSLVVFIEPPEAVAAGAQWRRVGTETWYDTGAVEQYILEGSHEIEFKVCAHWVKPENITLDVYQDSTTEWTAWYEPAPEGSLLIWIEPGEARDAGAQWRRVGTETWLNSGDLDTGVPEGDCEVEFKAIDHWVQPGNIIYYVERDVTTESTEWYEARHEGRLAVHILPPVAVEAGAQWRRVGTETWFDSDAIEEGILEGDYDVEFKDVPHWVTPGTKSVHIYWDWVTDTSGYYERAPEGALRVIIEPWEAADAGAQWRRVGTETWFASDAVEEQVPVGEHWIEFRDAPGWLGPEPTTVTINNEDLTELWSNFLADSSIPRMKTLPDLEWVGAGAAIVTAAFPNMVYIESDDRCAGIRVEHVGESFAQGTRLRLLGWLQTTYDGERFIYAESVRQSGTADPLMPLGLTNKALGGGPFIYESGGEWPWTNSGQIGVEGGTGLNNIGLLVKVWGNVSGRDQADPPTWVDVDDGSGVFVRCELPAGVIIDPAWERLSVTGISSCRLDGSSVLRLIRVRSQSDLVPVLDE